MKMTIRNSRSRQIVLLITSAALFAGIAACSRTTQMTDTSAPSGFLPQPALLETGKSGEPSQVYRNPQMASGGYDKIILDPVMIWAGAGSHLLDMPAEQQQALAENFHAHVYEALSAECQMVTAIEPKTVRIRLALVDAERSDPVLNTISTYIPQAHVVSTLAAFTFNDGAGVFAGSAAAEGYATDAKTGTLLWQGIDKRAGQNALGTNTFNTWEDVDNAFIAWSKEFASRLKKLGICHKSAA